MKKVFFFICFSVIIFSAPHVVYAQTGLQQAIKAYPDFESIPDPLRHSLMNIRNPNKQQFIEDTLVFIERYGRTKHALDQEDINNFLVEEQRSLKMNKIEKLLKYDLNLDSHITEDEIKISVIKASPGQKQDETILRRAMDYLMYLDTDKDKIISFQEMHGLSQAEEQELMESAHFRQMKELLMLDPNKDGKLTALELGSLAVQAFRTVDKDNNGMLSSDEMAFIAQKETEEREFNPACKMPKPSAQDKIILLATNEGAAASTVTLDGQEQITKAVSVNIADEPGSLYIIVAANHPVIWDMNGKTDRISHVVALGPHQFKKQKIAAGVAGVSDASKVYIQGVDLCLANNLPDVHGGSVKSTNKRLEHYLKRKADMVYGAYEMPAVQISAKGLVIENESAHIGEQDFNPPIPAGLDPDVWMETYSKAIYSPLLDLTGKQIIADSAVEPYQVLPRWAGLAKLVHDGYLERIGTQTLSRRPISYSETGPGPIFFREIQTHGSYKIVKAIPYYPTGLQSIYATTFILGKGIQPPQGDPGHSCVISEETEKPILNQMSCAVSPR